MATVKRSAQAFALLIFLGFTSMFAQQDETLKFNHMNDQILYDEYYKPPYILEKHFIDDLKHIKNCTTTDLRLTLMALSPFFVLPTGIGILSGCSIIKSLKIGTGVTLGAIALSYTCCKILDIAQHSAAGRKRYFRKRLAYAIYTNGRQQTLKVLPYPWVYWRYNLTLNEAFTQTVEAVKSELKQTANTNQLNAIEQILIQRQLDTKLDKFLSEYFASAPKGNPLWTDADWQQRYFD